MKNLNEYLVECLEAQKQDNNDHVNEAETIKSEKDFREAARAKFEEVFGDELDEEKMNKTIDGILEDHKDLVEKGEWGELIGILNESFAPKKEDNQE